MGQVFSGQPIVVESPAFNLNISPELEAFVLTISPYRLQEFQAGTPYYRSIIEIPDEQLVRLKYSKLIPGIPAEVYV